MFTIANEHAENLSQIILVATEIILNISIVQKQRITLFTKFPICEIIQYYLRQSLVCFVYLFLP